MQTNLYVIFDRVAEESGPVFTAINDGVAMRSYRNLVKELDQEARSEYRLYRLGYYDTFSMEVKSEFPPVEITSPWPASGPSEGKI